MDDLELTDVPMPEPESDQPSTCSACLETFPTCTGLILGGPLNDRWNMVEWRYCPTCAKQSYSPLLALLTDGKDCPHYDDERDTGEEHFGVFGLKAEIFVCEGCVSDIDLPQPQPHHTPG